MSEEEEKKPDSLEGILKWIQEQNKAEGKIEKSFEQYDKVIKDEKTLNEFFINYLTPGQDELYKVFEKGIKKEFHDKLDTKLEGKHREGIYKSLVEALKAFLEKTNKVSLDSLKEDADIEEQLAYLADTYDTLMLRHGKRSGGMTQLYQALVKQKNVAQMLKVFQKITEGHRDEYEQNLKEHAWDVFLAPYNKQQIAAHMYDEIHNEKGPHKIEDKMAWLTHDKDTLKEIRSHIKYGTPLQQGASLDTYGVEHIGYQK